MLELRKVHKVFQRRGQHTPTGGAETPPESGMPNDKMPLSLASMSANVMFRFATLLVQSIWVFLAAYVMTDSQLGEFRYLLSTAMILALFIHAGAPFYLVKTIAAGVPDPNFDTASTLNFVFQAQLYLLPLAVIFIVAWPEVSADAAPIVFVTAFALAVAQMIAFILLGGKRPLAQQLTRDFVPPAGFLVFLLLATAFGLSLDPFTSIGAYSVSALVACAVGWLLLARIGPNITLKPLRLISWRQTRAFWHKLTPFMLNQPIRLLIHNIDIVMLTWLTDFETVARYVVVSRMVNLLHIPESALNLALSPFYAGLPGSKASLSSIITISAVVSTITAIVGGVVLLALQDSLTVHFFDADAAFDPNVLLVLVLAAVYACAAGPATTILLMGGFERFNIRISLAALALNAALNALLIPWLGALGAALGTAGAVLLINTASVTLVLRNFQLNTTVFNRRSIEPATYRDYVGSLKSLVRRKRKNAGS